MNYLHTMVRIENLEKSLDFYVNKLGLKETRRYDSEAGRFTLIFLSADDDYNNAKEKSSPLIELTYNWPDENGKTEQYSHGRNFGHLAFAVDNIYEKCEQLQENGIDILRPPRDGYMAFIKSPDNISIELLQKGDSLEPIEPWLSMKSQGSW